MAGSSRRERSARLGITLLVAAAAVLAWLVAWQPGDGTPDPVALTANMLPPAPVATPATAPSVEPPQEQRTSMTADGRYWLDAMTADDDLPRQADADDPNAAVLRGRLTVRQQQWIHPAGVEIRLTRSWLDSVIPVETGPEQRLPLVDEPRAKTDDEGRFAFRYLPGGGEVFFLIGLGTAWQDFQKVKKQPRRGTEIDLGDVFLDQRGGIVGRVTIGGQPIAGAVLRAVDDPLLGASSGFEELRLARVEGLETYRAPGTLRGGPVPDWVVRRDKFLPFPKATTDGNGTFQLRGLRPGRHDVFIVTSSRLGTLIGDRRGVLVAPGRDTDVGAIGADWAPEVTITFVDEDQHPWIGAEVALVHAELGFGTASVRTDRNGTARLTAAAPEQASLLFGMPGGGPWLQLPWSYRGGRGDNVVHVPRPADLLVTLADHHGQPLAGGKVRAYVQARLFRPVDRPLPGGMQPAEREPGLYVGKAPCPVTVVAAAAGFAPAIANVNPKDGPVVMTLLPMESMVVRTHDLMNRPIADALVRVQVHDNPELDFCGAQWGSLADNRVIVGTTNDAGELTVPVWPAFFSFQATHRDYAPSAGPKVPAMPGQRLDLLMRGGADVVGQLTIQQRAAPKGFRVVARQKPPDQHVLASSPWLDQRRVVTGDDGTFTFRNLCAGIWEISPELPALPSPDGARRPRVGFRTLELALDEGQEVHCVLEAQDEGVTGPCITGSVLQDGARIAGAVVRLRPLPPPAAKEPDDDARMHSRPSRTSHRGGRRSPPPAEPMPWTHRCDTDVCGEFRFHELQAGAEFELRVDVLRDGNLQFVARRVLQAGTDRRPTLAEFAIATGCVHVSCTRNGDAYGNRMFRLRQSVGEGIEGARFDVLLDAQGRTFLDGLPAGQWTIEPMHGGRCEPAEFSLGPGGAIVVPVSILGI